MLDNIGEIYEWCTTTPLGMAAVVGILIVFFALVAVIYERRTRKLYPDRNRRGTKAVAKEKAARAAKKKDTEAD
ncbi:MAG: hypothetical protein LBU31_02025 [Coriobacteriales bacterium]|jgi:hypothetical protein|nr:hypothetical protein [Coriobacteriales bacterium]